MAPTVLLTGANAFYSAAIMDILVPAGYHIHGTVRSSRSIPYLQSRYGSSLTLFLVPDITIPTAFHLAVKGCSAIFHVASPFTPTFANARTDFLDPAINGALSALHAAASEPAVKRVILTSSVAAVIDPLHPTGFHRPGYTYTEEDWNPLSYEAASTMTAFPPVYTASKALAEKAAWEFMRKEKRHFDLVAINPCHTWGPYTQFVGSPREMNMTNSDLSKLMDGEEKDLPRCIMPWIVDIKSVAEAHVAALTKPEAGGKRYIVANAVMDFQRVVDLMHERFAGEEWIKNVPRGRPGTRQVERCFELDRGRGERELGLKYGDVEESVVAFCRQYGEDRKRWATAAAKGSDAEGGKEA